MTEKGFVLGETEILRLKVLVPGHLQGSLQRYVEYGIHPGDFLLAVLCNDLFGALNRADYKSIAGLQGLCTWIYNHVPSQCYGSRDKVVDWMLACRRKARESTLAEDGSQPGANPKDVL